MEEDREETSQNHTQTGSIANIRTQVQGPLVGGKGLQDWPRIKI